MLAYLDTSALIALAAASDKNHAAAVSHLRKALRTGTRFALGRPVLVEYLDGLTKRISKAEAIRQLEAVESSAVMRVEPDIEEDHRVARDLFLSYDDHAIDMTDSLSFAIMARLRLRDVFTFDRDFAIHGFARMP